MSSNRPKAVPTKQLENDRVIITEWRFAPGAETGWHIHGHDYIVVPGLDGQLLLESKEDETIVENLADLSAGISYFKGAGIEHNVVNPNDFEFHFVEVELK